MAKQILFISATHGDERIGLEALEEIPERADFDIVVGNPRALAQNTRFTDCDLNRAGAGNINSIRYEERRAAEIFQKTKAYTYTIDLHGTKLNTGIFLLVTNPTKANLRLASFFNIKNLVVWPSVTPEMQYPMSEFFPCGLEIESGSQAAPETTTELTASLRDFLKNLTAREKESETAWQNRLCQKNLFEMYGSIPADIGLDATKLKEFIPLTYRDELFTPVFVGTYLYTNILGYKLRSYTTVQFTKKFLT